MSFFNIHSFAKLQKKLKGDPLKTLKNFRKNEFNSLTVPKNLREGTLWDFLILVLLQNIKKLKGGPFGDIKNFQKKSHKAERGESHSSEKSENLLLRDSCKKISAYERVRTRTLWVEKQGSYH